MPPYAPPAAEPTYTTRDAAWSMQVYGGSFERALAHCWAVADQTNRAKLERDWSDLFERYRQVAETYGRKCE